MDESGNHHSQQSNTGTEKYHKFSLISGLNSENTWTQGGEQHTPGLVRGWGGRKGEHQDNCLMHVGLKT